MKQKESILRNAQHLRKNMTKEERHLWYDFLREYPVQFKRQFPVGNYIADFYCHRAQLVIELDGSQHCEADQCKYDENRTKFLHSKGLLVLRYSNLDVVKNFPGVCEHIDMAVKSRLRQDGAG